VTFWINKYICVPQIRINITKPLAEETGRRREEEEEEEEEEGESGGRRRKRLWRRLDRSREKESNKAETCGIDNKVAAQRRCDLLESRILELESVALFLPGRENLRTDDSPMCFH
jgi:hypothetical protein